MKTESQLAWVMVRAIGLVILLYSATRLIATAGNAYMAFTLRDHTAIVIRSDAPIPDHQQATPQNRQLVRSHGQARAAGIGVSPFKSSLRNKSGIEGGASSFDRTPALAKRKE